MASLLEKSLNFGLGLFAYSKEKVEHVVDELVKRGEVTRTDAQGLVDDMVKRGEEQREEVRKLVRDEMNRLLNYAGVAKKDDMVTREEIRSIIREELVRGLLEEKKKE